jgi:hypothetical protein
MLRIIVSGLSATAVGVIGGWTFLGAKRGSAAIPPVEAPRVPAGDLGANVGDEIVRLPPIVKAAPARPAIARPIETPLSAQPDPVLALATATARARETQIEVENKKPRRRFRRRDDDDG